MMVNPYTEYIRKRFDVVEMAGTRSGLDVAEVASRGRVHLEGFDLAGLGQFDAFGSMFPSTTVTSPTWWQGLVSQITNIVGQRIGPAPGTYQQTGPGGTIIIRQPEGSIAPFPTPTTATLAGKFDTGTGLILAAVGIGVLVLVMSRR